MFKKIFTIIAILSAVATIGATKIQTTAKDPAVKVYDVVETYDDTMIIETENGTEVLSFDGMTEAEMYARHVIYLDGEYFGIAD